MNPLTDINWSKDYRLNDYPRLPNGQPADYDLEDYLAWLEAYLRETDIEPHTGDHAIILILQRADPLNAMRLLGEHAGSDALICEERPFYRYPDAFDPETTDLRTLVPAHPDDEIIGDLSDPDPRCQQAFVQEDYAYHLRYKKELKEFRRLWPGFQKKWADDRNENTLRIEPPDAGWRVLLRAVIQPVSDRQTRIGLLRAFFETYEDTST